MVAISPFTARGTRLVVPREYATAGQGSGRATAFIAGARAASSGVPHICCPYKPGRGSGSWRRAWIAGHQAFTDAHGGEA